MNDKKPKLPHHEEEHRGPIHKHPYFIYIILTGILFAFLIVMTWVASEQGWIPNRGINR